MEESASSSFRCPRVSDLTQAASSNAIDASAKYCDMIFVMTFLRTWFPFLWPSSTRQAAQSLYIALVRQSRKPFFYTTWGVADTIDGRFDLIVLHVFIALHCLKREPGQEALCRMLQEALFDDMDRSLRE